MSDSSRRRPDEAGRRHEIEAQPGVPAEVREAQEAQVAEAYGDSTRVGTRRSAVPGDESTYTRRELMDGCRGLTVDGGPVRPWEVAGAMHLAGRTEMTRAEAEAAVREFRTRQARS